MRLLAIALALIGSVRLLTAATVNLVWDPNPETDIAGYRVYVGTASRNYTQTNHVGSVTAFSVPNLPLGTTYYFAVTAVNTAGLESDFSNEVTHAVPSKPSAPKNPRASLESVSWRATTNKSGLVTPILIVPGDEGLKVTAQITSPAGSVVKTGTVDASGKLELPGKNATHPFTATADITLVSIDPNVQSVSDF